MAAEPNFIFVDMRYFNWRQRLLEQLQEAEMEEAIFEAKQQLAEILLRFNRAVDGQRKAEATAAASEFLAAIRNFCKLIMAKEYDRTTLAVSHLIEALEATDEQAKRTAMLEVENWHAIEPAFVKNLLNFRILVWGME